jgi:hypothetical protein
MTMQTLHRTPMAVLQTRSVRNSSSARPSALPALPVRLSAPRHHRRSSTVVAAVDTEPPKTENQDKPDVAKFADSVGAWRSPPACVFPQTHSVLVLLPCNLFKEGAHGQNQYSFEAVKQFLL